MKKFFNSIRFISKAVLLILLLVAGWAFINVANLVKGRGADEKKGGSNLFGTNDANASIPQCGADCGGCSGCEAGCPHVAYFDGNSFRVENDFLLGKPKSHFTDYNMIKSLYEEGRIGPDLLRFSTVPQKRNGKLVLELQEIEEEESFVHRLALTRVIHPASSEVLVDSGFKKFFVFDKKEAEEKIIAATEAVLNGAENVMACFNGKKLFENDGGRAQRIFKRNDSIEFIFTGLKKEEVPLLVVTSLFRDWMMGEEKPAHRTFFFAQFLQSPQVARVAMFFVGALYLAIGKKAFGDAFALAPFIVGAAGSMCKSIVFSYRTEKGKYREVVIHEPRDWKEATEIISLPEDSVWGDGSLHIRADFTKRHQLNFVGILQGMKERPYRAEKIPVEKAVHSRVGDVTEKILNDKDGYAHMIPGDTVDIEFADPALPVSDGEKETYLMQSSGFYTSLRPEYKKVAGNWVEKLSPEAKAHYRELVDIRSYR